MTEDTLVRNPLAWKPLVWKPLVWKPLFRTPLRSPSMGLALALTAALAACGAPDSADLSAEDIAGGGELLARNAAAAPPLPSPAAEPGPSPSPATPAQSLEESRTTAIVRASDRVAPAVVAVNVIRTQRVQARSIWQDFFLPPGARRRTSGLGSGFIIDPDGVVLTNEHVVRGADSILVTLPDGRDLTAELVGADEVTDVAVLRISDQDLPVAPIGTSQGLLIGEWALAIGNPFANLISNAEPTVTAGVISAVDRHIIPQGGQDRGFYLGMIQTDASINPGNSGGPLVNALGEVIGVNSSIFTRSGGSEGLGFAIPIDRALRIADDLIRHGEVRRAWLGMNVEPMEADVWGRRRGVRVSTVVPGSPADMAAIQPGDRLVEAAGERLAGPLDFEAVLLDLRAGDALELVVEGVSRPVRLTAGELPSLRAERVTVLRDMELITLTPEIRAERGIQSETGALVVGISDQLRAQLSIVEGDVILQLNNDRIRSAEDVAEVLTLERRGPVRMYLERNGGLVVRDFVWR